MATDILVQNDLGKKRKKTACETVVWPLVDRVKKVIEKKWPSLLDSHTASGGLTSLSNIEGGWNLGRHNKVLRTLVSKSRFTRAQFCRLSNPEFGNQMSSFHMSPVWARCEIQKCHQLESGWWHFCSYFLRQKFFSVLLMSAPLTAQRY